MYSPFELKSRRDELFAIARKVLYTDLLNDKVRETFVHTMSARAVALPNKESGTFFEDCENLYALFRGDRYVPKNYALHTAICDRVAQKFGYADFDSTSKLHFRGEVLNALVGYTINSVNICRIEATEELIDKHSTIIYGRLKGKLKRGGNRFTRTKSEWDAIRADIEAVLRRSSNVPVTVATLATALAVDSDSIRHCAIRNLIKPLAGKQGKQQFHAVDDQGKRIPHDTRYNTNRLHYAYVYYDGADNRVQRMVSLLSEPLTSEDWRKAMGIKRDSFYSLRDSLVAQGFVTVETGARGAKIYTRTERDISEFDLSVGAPEPMPVQARPAPAAKTNEKVSTKPKPDAITKEEDMRYKPNPKFWEELREADSEELTPEQQAQEEAETAALMARIEARQAERELARAG